MHIHHLRNDSILYQVVCNFALLLVLNILWFSVADTRMRRSSQSIHTVIDVTLYIIQRILIDRIFNTNRCLFAFSSVACSTFNFNEKVALSAVFNTIDRSVGAYFFGPPYICMRRRSAQQQMTLSDLEWRFHASRAISAAADLLV